MVALLDNGVTVPIALSEYAHACIFSSQLAVIIVSEFHRITSFVSDCAIPILILLEKPLFVVL